MTHSSEPTTIRVEGLVKRYGERIAVDRISFEVARGEIFALLGPNGAGKTTTVEILEGYRKADGGQVEVLGMVPGESQLKQRVGIMLQDVGLYPAITAREAIELFRHFYPRTRSTDELLALVDLQEAAGTRFRRLSGGQRRRLGLALAVVGCPEVVFLDEPTAGLDPQARRGAWQIVTDLKAHGVTVVLTTHYLEEAERLADRLAILHRGRIISSGSPTDLVARDQAVVRLRTACPAPLEMLRALPAVHQVDGHGGEYVIETEDSGALLPEMTAALRDAGVPVMEIRVGTGSLEEVFLELTGGEEA